MSHYQRYPKYKDSGVEWLGEVPEHWEQKPFFAVTDEASRSNSGMIEDNVLSLSFGRIIPKPVSDNRGLVPDSYETYQIVEPKEIVFRLTDLQNDKRSLRSAIVRERGIISSAYLAVTPHNIDPEYVAWLMRAYDVCKVFYSMGGGLRQSLKYWDMKHLPVTVPAPEEQKRICRAIEKETTRIDALIEKKTRFIELLKEKLISIAMAEQIDGDGEFIRIQHLAQIIQRPVQIKMDEEYEPIGLYNRGRGLFHKPKTLGKDIGDSTFFYIKEGDLILSGQFAWEGAVTIASHEENGCVVSHRYPVLRGKTVSTKYLLALLMTSFGDFLLNDSSRGSAGRNRPLNINMLLGHKIRQPSEKAQKEIEKVFDLKTKIEKRVSKSITLLQERRSALITAAVTGQIDLRDAA